MGEIEIRNSPCLVRDWLMLLCLSGLVPAKRKWKVSSSFKNCTK